MARWVSVDWGLAEDFVPGGSRRDVDKWERLGVGVDEMGAGWGPLILVSWHWAYVGMSVGWEPGASLRVPCRVRAGRIS